MFALAPAGKTIQTFLFAAWITGLNNFYQAYSQYYTISAEDSYQQFLQKSYTARGKKLSEHELLWLWSVHLNALMIGNILGPFCTPWFCERLGRKMTIFVSNLGIVLALLLATSSVHFLVPELLLCSRILGATLSCLNFGAMALLITEFPPTALRGLVIFISGVSYNVCANLGMFLGMDALLGRNLEALVGLGLVPALLATVSSLPLMETPKFLLLNRQDKEGALRALEYYQGSKIDHDAVLAQIAKEREHSDDHRRPLLALLREMLAKRHLRLATLLSFCALQLIVGTLPITTTLLSQHFPLAEAQMYSFVCSAVSLAFNIPGTIMSTRVSRRALLLYAGMANCAFTVCYAAFDRLSAGVHPAFRYGCLVSNMAYFATHGLSLGTIPFFIPSELFPQNFRSMGQSLVFILSLCSGFTFNMFTLPAYAAIGVWAFFPLFIVPQIVCLTVLWLYLPETTGREVSEIVEELKRGRGAERRRNIIDARQYCQNSRLAPFEQFYAKELISVER